MMKLQQLKQIWTLAAGLLLLGASSGYAAMHYAYENFDTGLGKWTTVTTYNHVEGFDIGYSGTGYASGNPGEVGGTWAYINKKGSGATAPKMAHIVDKVSYLPSAGGALVSLNMPLHATGMMRLNDGVSPYPADCVVLVGFFKEGIVTGTTYRDALAENISLKIVPPAYNSQMWRFQWCGPDTSTSPIKTTVPDTSWNATPLRFDFTWTPSGLGNGSGTVSGFIQKPGDGILVLPPWTLGAKTRRNFDSFGIWAQSSNGTDITHTNTEWFDSMQYTVAPEPSAAWLTPLGGGLLLLIRRMLRRK